MVGFPRVIQVLCADTGLVHWEEVPSEEHEPLNPNQDPALDAEDQIRFQ